MNREIQTKTQLLYKLKNGDKVTVSHDHSSDDIDTYTINVGSNQIVEKFIRKRVLSGLARTNETICGYSYIYDENGNEVELIKTNPNIDINKSVLIINDLKKSPEFFNALISFKFIKNSPTNKIYPPSKEYTVIKEASTIDMDGNTLSYLTHYNYIAQNNNDSILINKEECFQMNDNEISIVEDYVSNNNSIFISINQNQYEFTSLEEIKQTNSLLFIEIKKIQDKLLPLKNINEERNNSNQTLKNQI